MATDTEDSLCIISRNRKFSFQLDEPILPEDESLLLEYARFMHDGVLHEKLAMAKLLDADNRGETEFQEVKRHFEKKSD